MAADVLAKGFAESLWLDPAVVFRPDDVERLRRHGLPFVCGLYPAATARVLACAFPPGVGEVRLGEGGGLTEVTSAGLGFALIRREVFEGVRDRRSGPPACFAPLDGLVPVPGQPAEDAAFCHRARGCGFAVTADTTIRLWRVGPHRHGWEELSGDRERHPGSVLRLPSPGRGAVAPAAGR